MYQSFVCMETKKGNLGRILGEAS